MSKTSYNGPMFEVETVPIVKTKWQTLYKRIKGGLWISFAFGVGILVGLFF